MTTSLWPLSRSRRPSKSRFISSVVSKVLLAMVISPHQPEPDSSLCQNTMLKVGWPLRTPFVTPNTLFVIETLRMTLPIDVSTANASAPDAAFAFHSPRLHSKRHRAERGRPRCARRRRRWRHRTAAPAAPEAHTREADVRGTTPGGSSWGYGEIREPVADLHVVTETFELKRTAPRNHVPLKAALVEVCSWPPDPRSLTPAGSTTGRPGSSGPWGSRRGGPCGLPPCTRAAARRCCPWCCCRPCRTCGHPRGGPEQCMRGAARRG